MCILKNCLFINSCSGCVYQCFVLFLLSASPTEGPPPPYAIAAITVLSLVVVIISVIIVCVLCLHFVVCPLNGRCSSYGEF